MPYQILGTSHIAKQSQKEIKAAIAQFDPDIVAVELDKRRYIGLKTEKKQSYPLALIRQIGIKGYLFAILGSTISKRLASKVGVMPGIDMLTAVEEANKQKKKVAFIDQDVLITLKKFNNALTWREKFRFVKEFFLGIFQKKKQMKKYGVKNLDLNKVPSKELIKKLLGYMQKEYPSLYKVLVDERNHFMAKKVNHLLKLNPRSKILIVVGAGHEEGMHPLIKHPQISENAQYSFAISVQQDDNSYAQYTI